MNIHRSPGKLDCWSKLVLASLHSLPAGTPSLAARKNNINKNTYKIHVALMLSKYLYIHITGSRPWPFGNKYNVIGYVTIWYPSSHFLSVLHCDRVCISRSFPDNSAQTCWGQDLDISRSRYVIGHETIRFAIRHFLLVVVNWNRASISNEFLDICIFIYLGHDLDLLGSRDVIDHVTIWYLSSHFL